MATLLKANVIQKAESNFTTGIDSRIVVGYLVGEINGAAVDDPFYQALTCVGIPTRGQQRAGFPGMCAMDFAQRPFSKNSKSKMWVLVTFRPIAAEAIGQPAFFELRGTTKTVTRAYANGQKILIPRVSNGHRMKDQVAQFTDTIGVGILTADWVSADDPGPSLYSFKNAVNNSTFNGAAKWTAWVSEVVIAKERFTSGYKCRIEIQHDPETWLQTAYWRDIGGIIPDDVDVIAASKADPGPAPISGSGGPVTVSNEGGWYRGTLKFEKSFNKLMTLIPGSALNMPKFA